MLISAIKTTPGLSINPVRPASNIKKDGSENRNSGPDTLNISPEALALALSDQEMKNTAKQLEDEIKYSEKKQTEKTTQPEQTEKAGFIDTAAKADRFATILMRELRRLISGPRASRVAA